MRNRIRGISLVLLLAAVTTGCGAVRNATSEQTSLSQRSSSGERLEAQAAAACDVRQHAQERMQAVRTTTLREYAEPVPEERTDMTIPMRHLLDLPDGAKYGAQNGRASVEAERQGDKIVVRGRCDSIARRCTCFENRVFRQRLLIDSLTARLDEMQAYRARADSLAATEAESALRTARLKRPAPTGIRWLLAGFLAGGAASLLLRRSGLLRNLLPHPGTGKR